MRLPWRWNISIEHQGRKIETIRLDNYTDGYAINGWELRLLKTIRDDVVSGT